MVQAYHAIFGTYGFWLPNDPRGSWSDWVYSWDLFRHGGPATKVNTRHSLAHQPYDRAAREAVKEHLKYPAVVFNDQQILSVAQGFERLSQKLGYQVFACAIMPDHVHLVLGRYRYKVETMVRLLKAEASAKLREDGLHPLMAYPEEDGTLPTPWAVKGWNVFLNSIEDIARAIRYVENNPVKEGKEPQRWPFVIPWIPNFV